MSDNAYRSTKSHEEMPNNEAIINQQKPFYKQHSSNSNGKAYNKQYSNKSDEYSSNTQDIVQKVDYSDYIYEIYDRYPNTKWPLHESWTFWYYKVNYQQSGQPDDWTKNGKKISEVSTIEDFWCAFNYLENPSKLELGCDLLMFKTGIEPTWEDPKNKNQGRWYLTLPYNENKLFDEIWKYTVLALIGDQFCGHSNESENEASVDDHNCHGICGIRVQRRKGSNRIALWTTDCRNEKLTKAIGNKWKENVETMVYRITYILHEGNEKDPLYDINGKLSPSDVYYQQQFRPNPTMPLNNKPLNE